MSHVASVAVLGCSCFPRHVKFNDLWHVQYVGHGLANLEGGLIEELVLRADNKILQNEKSLSCELMKRALGVKSASTATCEPCIRAQQESKRKHLGNLQVIGRWSLSSTAAGVVMAAMAGTEPTMIVSSIWQRNTPQVGAHADYHQPLHATDCQNIVAAALCHFC